MVIPAPGSLRAAINVQRLAGDVGRHFSRKKNRNATDIIGLA
jgi:hypothetical protein